MINHNNQQSLSIDSVNIFFQNQIIIDFLINGVTISENDQLSNLVSDGLQKHLKNKFIHHLPNSNLDYILLDILWNEDSKSISINSQQYTIQNHFKLNLNFIDQQLPIDQQIQDADNDQFILCFKIKDLLSFFKIQNKVLIKYHNQIFQVDNLLPLYPIDGCNDIIFNFMQEIFNIISNPQLLFTKNYPNKDSFLQKIFQSLFTLNDNNQIFYKYQQQICPDSIFNFDIYQQCIKTHFDKVQITLYLDNIVLISHYQLSLTIVSCFIQVILQILDIQPDQDHSFLFPIQKKILQQQKT